MQWLDLPKARPQGGERVLRELRAFSLRTCLGAVRRLTWRTALPYRLTFDMTATRIQPMTILEGRASGDGSRRQHEHGRECSRDVRDRAHETLSDCRFVPKSIGNVSTLSERTGRARATKLIIR